MKNSNSSRRSFIKKVAVGSAVIAATPTILTAKESSISRLKAPNQIEFDEKISANDNIQIALIGAGGMGEV